MSGKHFPPSTTGPARRSPRALRATALSGLALALVITLSAIGGASSDTQGAVATIRATTATKETVDTVRSLAEAQAQIAALARATTTTVPAPKPTPKPAPAPVPAPAPKPAVQPVATSSGYNDPDNPAAWDRIAQCESGGNWALSTGNGYYGGLQFSLSSWQAVGGTGYPNQASRETQIAMAQRLYRSGGGWTHWPACSRKLGYR